MTAPRGRVAGAREKTRKALGLPRRIKDLEAAVQENRQLQRKVAELTDVVVELLVPIADRDEAKVREVLDRYRSSTLAP